MTPFALVGCWVVLLVPPSSSTALLGERWQRQLKITKEGKKERSKESHMEGRRLLYIAPLTHEFTMQSGPGPSPGGVDATRG